MSKLKLAKEVSGIDPLYPSGYLQRILYLCSVLLGLTIAACPGQNSLPQGRFLSDSIDVGKPVFYALSFRHPQEKEVFFPDTTYNFAPFEVLSQKIFTSSTDEKGMLDSAIYQLISFDVAAAQVLQVPVFVFEKRDCTAVLSAPDTVFLKKEDLNILESQKALTPDTVLLPLNREFNFSKLIGTLAMIIGIGGSIYWVFGNDISKQWRLIKLQRRHLEYLRSFNRLLRNARDKGSIKDAEKAIIVWKNYLERLEKKPFATYTTREIMDNMPDENLAEALKNMDGMIYGQARSKKMDASLEVLKAGATKIYRNRRRQILDRQES